MRRSGVVVVVLLSLLAGTTLTACAGPKQWTPGPIITESVTPTATSTVTSSPTPTATATTPAAPAVPDPAGALDVSSYDSAHFASPTGRIWCALADDWALCHFPRDMNMKKVPKPSKVCPGAGLDVTGVSVTSKGADYFCSGGAESLPQVDGEYTAWWKPTGFPKVKYDGQDMATLPYGSKLVHGHLICLSEQSGMTCGDTGTRAGFKISRAGVTFIN